MPSQSGTYHAPRCRNMVSCYGAGCGARCLGKTNGRWRCCWHRAARSNGMFPRSTAAVSVWHRLTDQCQTGGRTW